MLRFVHRLQEGRREMQDRRPLYPNHGVSETSIPPNYGASILISEIHAPGESDKVIDHNQFPVIPGQNRIPWSPRAEEPQPVIVGENSDPLRMLTLQFVQSTSHSRCLQAPEGIIHNTHFLLTHDIGDRSRTEKGIRHRSQDTFGTGMESLNNSCGSSQSRQTDREKGRKKERERERREAISETHDISSLQSIQHSIEHRSTNFVVPP